MRETALLVTWFLTRAKFRNKNLDFKGQRKLYVSVDIFIDPGKLPLLVFEQVFAAIAER